jgi:hypothetical protein
MGEINLKERLIVFFSEFEFRFEVDWLVRAGRKFNEG